MAFTDWTIEEKKEIIGILKDYPASVRLSVRDKIKDMSASDALETAKALLSPSEDVKGDNIPLSDKKPLKDKISPLETKSKAGSRHKKNPGSSYKEKSPAKAPAKPAKPSKAVKGSIKPLETVKAPDKPLERVQGDIMTDTFDIAEIKARVDALSGNQRTHRKKYFLLFIDFRADINSPTQERKRAVNVRT